MADQETTLTDREADEAIASPEDRPILPPRVHEGKFTVKLALLTLLSAIGGFLFGYDTGVVSGAMLFIKEEYHLNSLWQELVVSVTIGAAAVFAIFAGFLNDKLGRKPVILISSVVFTIGAVLMGSANSKTMLLIGRLIVGAGIGLVSMTVPVYIAESAPSHMRGKLVTLNNLFITCGQFSAGLVDGAFNYVDNGWRYMLGLAGLPSFIQLIGFIFMPESPRWLVSRGRTAEARKVLENMRGGAGPLVDAELAEIQTNYANSASALDEKGTSFARQPVMIQMLRLARTRRALFVGCGLQLFQQVVGINTIMYYSATIIRMSGVKDQATAVWLSAVVGGVNALFTVVGIFLVDRIGRKPLVLGSLIGVFFALITLAVGFQVAADNSVAVTVSEQTGNFSSACQIFQTCDSCVSHAACGFCYDEISSTAAANGSCVPSHDNSLKSSLFGRCSNPKPPVVWAFDFCPSAYAWLATFGLVLYIMFFAPGMGPMPWTINSEIYPLWARSAGTSLATATNWLSNLLISMTFLTLTEAITKYGAFWLYASLCFLAICFVIKFVPETKDKTLEEIEEIWDQEFF